MTLEAAGLLSVIACNLLASDLRLKQQTTQTELLQHSTVRNACHQVTVDIDQI